MSVPESLRVVLEIRRTRRADGIALVCAGILLVACGSALGAPSWLPAAALSAAGGDATLPQVAVDRQGDAVAVWQRDNGASTIVQAAVRQAGGAWGAPVDLSAAGQEARDPRVAVNAQRDAAAVWLLSNGSNYIVQAATRPADGGWRAPLDQSVPGQGALNPEVAADPQGNAIVVWQRFNGAKYIVQAAGDDSAGPLLDTLSVPASGIAGLPVSLSVSPLDVWSPVTSTGWRFGDGQSASGASVNHTYAAPGTYTVSLTTADTLANATSATASIAIAPASAPPAAGSPVLSNISQSHRIWREGSKQARLARRPSRKPPIGTTSRSRST